MDYFDIIKKSYKIALKNKYLWVFAILVGIGYGGSRWFGLGSDSGTYNFTGVEYLLISFVVLVVMVAFWILGLTSEGALIMGVAQIEKDEATDFKTSFEAGWHKFFRIFLLKLLIGAIVFASVLVIALPVGLLIYSQSYVFAIILGIILFLAGLFLWFILAFIYPYSVRMVVLEKRGIVKTLRESLHLVRDNIKEVVVMYLLVYAISMGFGMVLIFGALLSGVLLFAIGVGIWLASPLAAIIYGSLSVTVFILAILIANSGYTTFSSSVFTLTYLRLKK